MGRNMEKPQCILVTGATGYIGGRLIPRLLSAGYHVRTMARDPNRLIGRPWSDKVEPVQADVTQLDTLHNALAGVDVAYYFIHSMAGSRDFHEKDVQAARDFGQAAKNAGVKRIIYLGGLGDNASGLSEHLQSRQETGRALAESGVPVTEFRAAVIVGSGSISFEMIRYLTERLPIMICPRWVYNRIQPISIRNVLDYLVAALETPASVGRIIEIGGADVQTYASMMMTYAAQRGLKRYLIPVPVLTPWLSSYWVHWMTPINARVARALIEGIRNEVVVQDDSARRIFPDITPMDYQTAVALALVKLNADEVETTWNDAMGRSPSEIVFLTSEEGMITEYRKKEINARASDVFQIISSLGGANGWPSYNWAWQLRGLLDRLVGGSGLRRGRRHPHEIRVGDAVDFWRVEKVESNKMLRLRAEMKVPGRAWLQFEVQPLSDHRTQLIQKAFFAPKGLFGHLYWYGLYPIHSFLFSSMIRTIGNQAEALSRAAHEQPLNSANKFDCN
ncbi:MAG: SDR family oxidoreductase [Anaerolineae bacterium]|nr:SDR family oxidoreductase [Anaerolineae bacterium]